MYEIVIYLREQGPGDPNNVATHPRPHIEQTESIDEAEQLVKTINRNGCWYKAGNHCYFIPAHMIAEVRISPMSIKIPKKKKI